LTAAHRLRDPYRTVNISELLGHADRLSCQIHPAGRSVLTIGLKNLVRASGPYRSPTAPTTWRWTSFIARHGPEPRSAAIIFTVHSSSFSCIEGGSPGPSAMV
jgi:hypothetical protein